MIGHIMVFIMLLMAAILETLDNKAVSISLAVFAALMAKDLIMEQK